MLNAAMGVADLHNHFRKTFDDAEKEFHTEIRRIVCALNASGAANVKFKYPPA